MKSEDVAEMKYNWVVRVVLGRLVLEVLVAGRNQLSYLNKICVSRSMDYTPELILGVV